MTGEGRKGEKEKTHKKQELEPPWPGERNDSSTNAPPHFVSLAKEDKRTPASLIFAIKERA